MVMLDVDLVRMTAAPEIRTTVDGSLGRLVLRFSTFDTWYEVDSYWEGTFLERTRPGAFKQTIKDDRDGMRSLFDHGYDPQIGNKVLGPIDDLREDPDSPVAEVPLFDTSYNRDLLPGLRAKVYGSSFRFRVQAEEWDDEPEASETNPKGLPERSITRVKLMEMGPVTFPANPDASAEMNSASVRCLTDQFYGRLKERDPQAYDAAVRSAGITFPTETVNFTGQPARGAGGGDSDRARAGAAQRSSDPFDDAERRHLLLRIQGVIA